MSFASFGFTVTFAGIGDALDESNESYTLSIGGQSGTGTITDDDTASVASVGDDTQVEGTDLVHTVTMSTAADTAKSYDFSLTDVTATRVSSVERIMPPMTATASGALTSAPAPTPS